MPPQPPPRPVTPSQRFNNTHRYVPPHAEQAIAKRQQRSIPTGQAGYSSTPGQSLSAANLPGYNPLASAASQFAPHAPGFHLPRQSNAYKARLPQPPEPHAVPGVQTTSPQSEPSSPTPGQPGQPLAPTTVTPPDVYDFITQPQQPGSKLPLSLPGRNSLPMRIALVAGGLFVLVILISAFKGLLGSHSNLTPFVGIAQDQQELIHLVAGAAEQPNISIVNQNFAATAQLTIGSAQAATIKYLSANGQKVEPKILNLKISASLDARLTAAKAATTYDQTFQQIMQTALTAYTSNLKQGIQPSTGKNGRALLNSDIQQAQLLLTQLNGNAQ